MKPRLLPCPFCGPRPERDDWTPLLRVFGLPDVPAFAVVCRRCYAHGPRAASEETAAALWNVRYVPEAPAHGERPRAV